MNREQYQKLRRLFVETVVCPQCGEESVRAEKKDPKNRRGYSHLDCPYCGDTFEWMTTGKSHLYSKDEVARHEREYGSLIDTLQDERTGMFGAFTRGHFDDL